LPLKRSKGHFYEKYHFSPVKNVKKCRGRELNSILPVRPGSNPFPCIFSFLALLLVDYYVDNKK
jgi:hypothetical protein